MKKFYQIAVDGPSGVGKSTIAQLVAKKLKFVFLNTGKIFRAVAWWIINNNCDFINDYANTIISINNISLSYCDEKIYLNGRDIDSELQNGDIAALASAIAKDEQVRKFVFEIEKSIMETNDVVMDGRDIGTNIMPNANLKVFLDCDPAIRAKRRMKQENIPESEYEKLLQSIIERDKQDIMRKIAPLQMAPDAILIRTDNDSATAIANEIVELFHKKVK